jgi:hypothetical protein
VSLVSAGWLLIDCRNLVEVASFEKRKGTLNKGAEPKVNLVSRSHSKFWFGWITIIQIEQNDMAGLAANYISDS